MKVLVGRGLFFEDGGQDEKPEDMGAVSLSGEFLADMGQGLGHMAFGGGDGYIEFTGDLLMGTAFDAAEPVNLLLLRRQFVDGDVDEGLRFFEGEKMFGVLAGGGGAFFILRGQGHELDIFADGADQDIASEDEEPVFEPFDHGEFVSCVPNPDEDILGEVFGLRDGAGIGEGHREDLILVVVKDRPEGLFIAFGHL